MKTHTPLLPPFTFFNVESIRIKGSSLLTPFCAELEAVDFEDALFIVGLPICEYNLPCNSSVQDFTA